MRGPEIAAQQRPRIVNEQDRGRDTGAGDRQAGEHAHERGRPHPGPPARPAPTPPASGERRHPSAVV